MVGEHQEGISTLRKSLEIADSLGEERLIAHAKSRIARAYWHLLEYEKSLETLPEAIALMEQQGNLVEVSFSLSYVALCEQNLGKLKEAEQNFKKAIDLAHETGHLASVVYAKGLELQTDWVWESRIEGAQAILDSASRVGFLVNVILARFLIGHAKFHGGEKEEGLALCLETAALIESTDTAFQQFPNYLGEFAFCSGLSGRKEETLALAKKATELDKRAGIKSIPVFWGNAIATALTEPPNWKAMRSQMEDALTLAGRRGERPYLALTHFHYAELLHMQGEQGKSREQFAEAKALFSEMKMGCWLKAAAELEEKLGLELPQRLPTTPGSRHAT